MNREEMKTALSKVYHFDDLAFSAMDNEDMAHELKAYCPKCGDQMLNGNHKTSYGDRVMGPTEIYQMTCGHYTL